MPIAKVMGMFAIEAYTSLLLIQDSYKQPSNAASSQAMCHAQTAIHPGNSLCTKQLYTQAMGYACVLKQDKHYNLRPLTVVPYKYDVVQPWWGKKVYA